MNKTSFKDEKPGGRKIGGRRKQTCDLGVVMNINEDGFNISFRSIKLAVVSIVSYS